MDFLTFLLLISLYLPSFAIPTANRVIVPPVDPRKILCQLPILKKFLCPPTGIPAAAALTRKTVLGTAQGTNDPSGAQRFAVKYASASRWAPSTLATTWQLPNGSTNVTALPLACPQPGVDPSAFTEDCLSMMLYVPPNLDSTSNVPTLLWVHGGSFIVGSATGPGLDGSNLAIATNSIVAVVQYRLGALGFLAPSGQTNLAVKDLMNALQFLAKVVPAFGGSASKITLAGQSSGASMIRALLAVPSASSLFRSAILQSDPMDFGFLSMTTQKTLQTYFNSGIGCGSTNTACTRALALDAILDAQNDVFSNAIDLDPAAGNSEPIRPVLDGSLITTPLDSTAPFPPVNKPVLVTTVAEDAGFAIYLNSPSSVPEDEFIPALNQTFGPSRTETIINSNFYPPVPASDGSIDARVQLQTLGTDYLWRCSSWTFARNWAQNGGAVYVGQFVVGATYPGNEVVPYCTQPGIVCHQDDIEIIFGTVPSPTSLQSALVTEMQARYKAFLSTGNPNAVGFNTWTPATNSDVHALVLGGSGEVSIGACAPSFWGSSVQYDYQFFDE